MFCVLFSKSIKSDFLWVTLLLFVIHYDTIASAADTSNNGIKANSMPSHDMNDSDKEIRSNFTSTNEVTSTTTPTLSYALTDKIASKSSSSSTTTTTTNACERQKVSDSLLHDNNDYQSMKHAIDTQSFNEKMNVYMDYQANEMAAHTIKLNSLKDKLNTLDVLHHELDRLVNRQNVVEQSLQVIRDAILGSQSINNKLERLELMMRQTNVRIDDFVAKQWKWTTPSPPPSSDETKRKTNADDDDSMSGSNEQCETKIDQLIAFVHNSAELNRLENTDILNRLGTMQSQLIQFFDTKSTIALHRLNHTAHVNETRGSDFLTPDELLLNLIFSNDTKVPNVTNDATNATADELFETTTIATTTTPFTVNDEQNMRNSSLRLVRKRKRTANRRNFRRQRSHNLNTQTQTVENNKYTKLNFPHTIGGNSNVHINQIDGDIDVNLGIIKSNNQISASKIYRFSYTKHTIQKLLYIMNETNSIGYGQPSQIGCHQFVNIDRADEIHHFPTKMGSISERLCSFDKNGSAWTVIQFRGLQNNLSIPENFNRSWSDYKYGFGNLSSEFWYGNDFIHKLTYDDDMELKIELDAWDGRHMEFQYETFRIDSEQNRYNLFVNGFNGNDKQFDALKYHHNQDFSTFDKQNDKSGINDDERCCSCAKSYASGWWFNNCIEANLNGVYQFNPFNNNYVGIIWEKWLGDYSLKSTKMMIRPKVNWTNHNENDKENKQNRPPDDP